MSNTQLLNNSGGRQSSTSPTEPSAAKVAKATISELVHVYSGQTLANDTVWIGGVVVHDGGIAANLTISLDSIIRVLPGGSAVGITANDIQSFIRLEGGFGANLSCFPACAPYGGITVLSAGVVVNAFIGRWCSIGISQNSNARQISTDSGSISVDAFSEISDCDLSAGHLAITSSSIASGVSLKDGSTMSVDRSEIADLTMEYSSAYVSYCNTSNVELKSQSQLTASTSGTVRNVNIHGNSLFELVGYQSPNYITAYDTMIDSGIMLVTGSGATASATMVGMNGTMVLQRRSRAVGTVVNGGMMSVLSGSIASATSVRFGTLAVHSKGSAVDTILSPGGLLAVYSGGIATGTVDKGGAFYNATQNTVSIGSRVVTHYGWQLDSSGVTSQTIVSAGGSAHTVTTTSSYTDSTSERQLIYSLSTESGSSILSIFGQYKYLYGWQDGNDCRIAAANCRLVNGLYGVTSGVSSISGNVDIYFNPASGVNNTGNMYGGGGNGTTVGGNVKFELDGTGTCKGLIYGGGYAGTANSVVSGCVELDVNGITHQQNAALTGHTDWLFAGGAAANGKSSTVGGATSISISGGASLGSVFGGGSATGSGSVASVGGGCSITIENATISGSVYGGGYAYNGGSSTVAGGVAISVKATSGAAVSIQENICIGGLSGTVSGAGSVTFSGSGAYLNFSGTVSGAGASGVNTLGFSDFSGAFTADIAEIDRISASGNTAAVISDSYVCNNFTFDLTGRRAANSSTALLRRGASGGLVLDSAGGNQLTVILDTGDFTGIQRMELMELGTSTVSDLTITLLDPTGATLASLDYDLNETWSSGGRTYGVSLTSGGLLGLNIN